MLAAPQAECCCAFHGARRSRQVAPSAAAATWLAIEPWFWTGCKIEKTAGHENEKQEKIRNIVKNLDVEHSDDGVKVFAFKTGDADVEKHIEIHSDADFTTTEGNNVFVMSDDTKHAQVFKFKFEENEGDGAFIAIKHLLESSDLTPTQIVELQNILSQK